MKTNYRRIAKGFDTLPDSPLVELLRLLQQQRSLLPWALKYAADGDADRALGDAWTRETSPSAMMSIAKYSDDAPALRGCLHGHEQVEHTYEKKANGYDVFRRPASCPICSRAKSHHAPVRLCIVACEIIRTAGTRPRWDQLPDRLKKAA